MAPIKLIESKNELPSPRGEGLFAARLQPVRIAVCVNMAGPFNGSTRLVGYGVRGLRKIQI